MEVEVGVPTPFLDFNFDSNCSSPYMTAPSSPQRIGNFFVSAPTSPGFPRCKPNNRPMKDDEHQEFEFNFSVQLEQVALSAEELFDRGKIRPSKTTTELQSFYQGGPSPPAPNASSPRSKRIFQEALLSPRHEEKETLKTDHSRNNSQRDKAVPSAISNSRASNHASTSSPSIHSSFFSSYRKWGIKNFLLFRSASEGRTDSKDPLRKFTVLSKKVMEEDVKNSSFRSVENSGSVSRRRGTVSPHELHYTVNRAVSEKMKKKTFLPYKQGLLGCLGPRV